MTLAGSFLLDDPPDVMDRQSTHDKYVPDCRGIVMAASMPNSISRAVGRRRAAIYMKDCPRHILDALIASGHDRNRRFALSIFICANGSHDIGLISVPV